MDHHLSTTGASSWTNMENKNRRLLWDQTVFSMQANAAVTRVFKKTTQLGMACFEPGHFEAGMRGTLKVAPGS